MNATKKKILVFLAALIFCMLLIPILVINIAPADAGMALCFLLFFAVNPFFVIAFGIVAGTELRKLWWFPVATSAVFPLFFWIAVGDFVWELWIYSALYFCVGVLAMLGTYLGRSLGKKKG